jgi:hypothetical protein
MTIDYFFRWANTAEAKADVLMLADHLNPPSNTGIRDWKNDHVLPNVKAWRPSQDTYANTVVLEGQQVQVVVHNYLSGWFAIIAANGRVPVLLNADALGFALDRDACNEGKPFVIKNNIGAVIRDVAVEPVFAGSNYPMGDYKFSYLLSIDSGTYTLSGKAVT